MRHARRSLALCALVAAGAAATPRPSSAQWVVFDPANLGQAVTGFVQDGLAYATQILEYAEAVQGVLHLGRQVEQLDSTYAHQKQAWAGELGKLGSLFSALSTADASTLLDADFGSWRNQLQGAAGSLTGALGSMDGASLSSYLLNELNTADDVTAAQLRALYPNHPEKGDSLAARWTRGRERGDKIRAGDFATAEAAGRVVALLEDVQTDIDQRKGQTELAHTALQQAMLSAQLTGGELDVALAQLEALRLQRDALARQEAELMHRAAMVAWLAREQADQQEADHLRTELEATRGTWGDVGRLAAIW